MRIQHNIAAMNSFRNQKANARSLSKNLEKLSSGYRINRSADDAAGLSVSEKMRCEITGMDRAQDNAQEGINLIQTAEGALTEVHGMLNRMITLATQSANGTYTDAERAGLNGEMTQLKTEIDRIGSSSNFNGIALFQGGNNPNVAAKRVYNYEMTLDLKTGTCSVLSSGVNASSASLDFSGVADGYQLLAEKIATEYFPNAITQILDAFPSLSGAIGGDTIDMKLEMASIDGASNTLAYAQFSFYSTPGSEPINMLIRVDTSDFSDASLSNGDLEMLESTLAHELMHSVMQYTMTDEMSGRTGAGEEFPTWFSEGTAQLAGGGFPTNWNATIEYLVGALGSEADTAKDADIADYLANYTVDGRPYGHGYLASAYLGYLANGGTGAVTGASIAAGMNNIFADILAGKTLYEAVSNRTSLGTFTSMSALTSKLNSLFSGKDAGMVEFVRKLGFASKGGAGSVITPNMNDGGGDIIGTGATSSPFTVVDVSSVGGGAGVTITSADEIQLAIGVAGGSDIMNVDLFEMNSTALNLDTVDIASDTNAQVAITAVKTAVEKISAIRGYYGAVQNRLEHTINNIGVMSENLTDAESVIRDTDVAEEMMKYTKNTILVQSAQAMLAQANTVPEGVMALLR